MAKQDNVSIYYQNVRGLKSKTHLLYENILACNYDIIILTETWLDSTVYDREVCDDRYRVFRQERSGRRGGGVLAALKQPCTVISSEGKSISWDGLILKTKMYGYIWYICIVYIPPSSNIAKYLEFYEWIELHEEIQYNNVIILGDFNIPELNVTNSDFCTGGKDINELKNFISLYNLTSFNYVQNVNKRTLDLVLSNYVQTVVSESDDPLVPIDKHHPSLDISLNIQRASNSFPIKIESSYDFRRADFNALYTGLQNINWHMLYSLNDIDKAVECFYNNVYSILNSTVPRTPHKKRSKYPLWFTSEIKNQLKLKEFHRKRRTRSEVDNQQFKLLRAKAKKLINIAHRNYIQTTEENINANSNSFWSYIKNKKRNCSNNEDIMYYGDEELKSGTAVADGFARYFESVYSQNEASYEIPDMSTSPHDLLNIEHISINEITTALKKLKAKTSAGPDHIPPYIIKGCGNVLIQPLYFIFNLSIKNRTFPSVWKNTRVCPIYKSGKQSIVNNYRPIAVLSSIAKIFEFIICKSILSHVQKNISECQHGFVPKRSTTTNLANFSQDISTTLDLGGQTDVIYTDFKNAFDKVDHDQLILKLNKNGFSPPLIRFFSSYLKHRTQYVSYHRTSSNTFVTRSGIPQGSNLGPILFLLFINDLPDVVTHSKCLLYADDLKLYKTITNINDCNLLQTDLLHIFQWSVANKLPFNVPKCISMTITRKANPINCVYTIEMENLKSVAEHKDLGVSFNNMLTFGNHIKHIVNNAYKLLGFVIRNSKAFLCTSTVITLYRSLVRPKLEYASVIWNPNYTKYIIMIERTQYRFLKLLYMKKYGEYPHKVEYNTLLLDFNCSTLSNRRCITDMIFLYKIVNSIIDNSYFLSLLNFNVPRKLSRSVKTFYIVNIKTVSHSNSTLVRLCTKYNSIVCNNICLDFGTRLNTFMATLKTITL